jgi:hypothetical protein
MYIVTKNEQNKIVASCSFLTPLDIECVLFFYCASILGVGNEVMGIFSSDDNGAICEYDLIVVYVIAEL